jgi:hypothetical protein
MTDRARLDALKMTHDPDALTTPEASAIADLVNKLAPDYGLTVTSIALFGASRPRYEGMLTLEVIFDAQWYFRAWISTLAAADQPKFYVRDFLRGARQFFERTEEERRALRKDSKIGNPKGIRG